MSSGMNLVEAEEYAKNMSYRTAVNNALHASCVPYKKATKIKLRDLLNEVDNIDQIKEQTRLDTINEFLLNLRRQCGMVSIAFDGAKSDYEANIVTAEEFEDIAKKMINKEPVEIQC